MKRKKRNIKRETHAPCFEFCSSFDCQWCHAQIHDLNTKQAEEMEVLHSLDSSGHGERLGEQMGANTTPKVEKY